LRGKTTSLANEEAISGDAQGGMVMKAAPAAAFVVIQTKLLFQFLVIALNSPA
jgi:hypothetical protein